MCNFKNNLVAWMDGELPPVEAEAVEQHLKACAACRECVSAYGNASQQFATYYQSATAPKPAPVRATLRWLPYVAAAAAVIAIVLMTFPRSRDQRSTAPQVTTATSGPSEKGPVPATTAKATRAVAAHHATAAVNSHPVGQAPAPAAIQIAIPADAVFPPGAVPEGFTYIARLAADGSLQDFRVQP
jgi:anti-sigma factor RsiW